MPQQAPNSSLDDVQVLGEWNFTMQGDTPLHWLKTGQMDRYLMKMKIHSPCPSTAGLVLHAEVDGPGTDGVSFWIERQAPRKGSEEGTKRYMLAGEGLESKPIVTRAYPDPGGGEQVEEVEVLMEGYRGTIFVQDRKVQLRFRTKHSKGSLAFYNSTSGDVDYVHFGNVRITALRRGPLELSGKARAREQKLGQLQEEGKFDRSLQESSVSVSTSPMKPAKGSFNSTSLAQMHDSVSSTMAPDSIGGSNQHSTSMMSAGNTWSQGMSIELGRSISGRTQFPSSSPVGAHSTQPGRQAPRGRMQLSASEGTLHKSGTLLGRSGQGIASPKRHPALGASQSSFASTRSGGHGAAGGKQWIPLATNAPAGEQELLKSISQKPNRSNRACMDFIPV